jgi:hypothetical protein
MGVIAVIDLVVVSFTAEPKLAKVMQEVLVII